MPKFENFGSKFSKANVKFEISTFAIGDMPNLVKIRKLILFGPKCQNLSILGHNISEHECEVSNQYLGNRVQAKFRSD